MSWTTRPLLGFDTETTGVQVETDRIVTAALVRREPGGSTEVATWLIDPGVDIPVEASAIHGITTEHARLYGRAPGAALEEIARTLADAVLNGVPVVAFNASFDLRILEAELRRHGLPTLAARVGDRCTHVIDPLVLDRAADRYRKGKRKLGDLCAVYDVLGDGDLHTADVDVIATLDVLAAITQRHPHLAALTPQDLHDYQVTAHREWAEGFNSWRERQGLPGPGASALWP